MSPVVRTRLRCVAPQRVRPGNCNPGTPEPVWAIFEPVQVGTPTVWAGCGGDFDTRGVLCKLKARRGPITAAGKADRRIDVLKHFYIGAKNAV